MVILALLISFPMVVTVLVPAMLQYWKVIEMVDEDDLSHVKDSCVET